MEFDEKGNILTFTRCDNCFVYFLLQGNEVVYVGQTTAGLSRPFSHHDKEYDSIKVLPCPADKIDETEDRFIIKYKPKYNKIRNYNIVFSLNRVKSLIKKYYDPKFNMWGLRKVLRELNIVPFCDQYTRNESITIEQYREIEKYFEGGIRYE